MHDKNQVLTLLFLVVFAAGCLNGASSEGPEAVEVRELSVNPSQVHEGDTSRVVTEAANMGNIPADLQVEEDGENILIDRCQDDFDLEEFSYNTPPNSEVSEGVYSLDNGDSIRMDWNLEQSGEVPLYDISCDLSFRLPFNYSVQAFQQIEVKEDSSVEGAEALESRSSSGPMYMSINTLSGAAQEPNTYVQGEDSTITVEMQFVNQEVEEGYEAGVVNIDQDSMDIDISDELLGGEEVEDICNDPVDEGVNMHEGQSEVIVCDLEVPDELDGPAEIFDVSIEADYEYVKNAGSRTIQVSPRG